VCDDVKESMSETKPVALVTGGAKRLGQVIALKLAGGGYRVAIHYHMSKKEAEELAARLCALYGAGAAAAFGADITSPVACDNLAAAVVETFGRLDLLVNNASVFAKNPIDTVRAGDFEKYHAVHVVAPFFLSVAAAEHLRTSAPGRIVNILDIYADIPRAGYTPYTVSKAGLKALTKQLALELAPAILVNAVAPGAILEPAGGMDEAMKRSMLAKIPMGRFGAPEDIAAAVLFFTTADYLTGHVLNVDGGRVMNS